MVKEKIVSIQVVRRKSVPEELHGDIVRFIGDFQNLMETAPMYERRELIRKCVSKIFVDRQEKVARCFVRQLPAVNAQIMELYEAEETRLENLTEEELRRVYVTNGVPRQKSVRPQHSEFKLKSVSFSGVINLTTDPNDPTSLRVLSRHLQIEVTASARKPVPQKAT